MFDIPFTTYVDDEKGNPGNRVSPREENVEDLFNNGDVLPVLKMKDMATESYRFLMKTSNCHPKEKQNPGRIPG